MDINTCWARRRSDGTVWCLTGGEGCQLYSWQLRNGDSRASSVEALPQAHISSIRAMSVSVPAQKYLLTAGGRGQICLWRMSSWGSKPSLVGWTRIRLPQEASSSACDFRIMALFAHEIGPDQLQLYYATSHGEFAQMSVRDCVSSATFAKPELLIETNSCILTMSALSLDNHFSFMLGDSRGQLHIHPQNLPQLQPGKSALNALSAQQHSAHCFSVLCGSDDGSVRIATVRETSMYWESDLINHYAAIVDVALKDEIGISLGADHRLSTIQIRGGEMSLLRTLVLNGIGDPHCLLLLEDQVLVCGLGVQLVRLLSDAKNCSS
ncbi:hypothetical protein Ciccas_009330 [Cichlidogyrus casuarinus]|uniref:Uncharacterized protein n=1 Tax=Cichlidogyrus casuarinus TaxID=1844966 RepID=A0ABD2PXC7_9PLAT